MGLLDNEYKIDYAVELDEGFFSISIPEEDKGITLKRGKDKHTKTETRFYNRCLF